MTNSNRSQYDYEVALAEMARDLQAQETLQATLDRIVTHAVDLIDGCERGGIITLHRGNQVFSAAATDDLVRQSDQAQHELGEGPCFDALSHGEAINRIADMNAFGTQWPSFAPRARSLGVGSMLGLLLYTDSEQDFGALNLYSSQRNAFTERSERVGWLLASHAAVLYASARTHAQLETALASRKDIGEALGLIMATYHLNEDQALQLLKKISQDRHMKLRDLARAVNNGDLDL